MGSLTGMLAASPGPREHSEPGQPQARVCGTQSCLPCKVGVQGPPVEASMSREVQRGSWDGKGPTVSAGGFCPLLWG